MKTVRNLAFVVLCLVTPFALAVPGYASWGCTRIWEGPTGYDVVCDNWPDPAWCPAEWELEDACVDWCWNYNTQYWIASSWGCSFEGEYQSEFWCGCWDPH